MIWPESTDAPLANATEAEARRRITTDPPLQSTRDGTAFGPTALIVLAGGAARRAGRIKALVRDPAGRPLIGATLDALARAPIDGPRLVVLGCEAAPISAALATRSDAQNWQLVACAEWMEGMAASLRAGLAALPTGMDAALIALADMPHLSGSMLQDLVACRRGDRTRIVAPSHEQQRGHPVVWGAAHFAVLSAIRGDEGGRTIFAQHPGAVTLLPADAGCLIDYDTPAALAGWERGF